MFRYLVSTILVAVAAVAVSANDTSIVAVGGSAVPLLGEHPQVRMVRETVHLDLYKDDYATSVDFVFANIGGPITVTMGFPERGVGTEGVRVSGVIKGFATTVDGKPVTAMRMKSKVDNDSYEAYWTKTVDFAKNQERKVHVEFHSPYGEGIGGKLAAYDFTGGNWHGKVAESDLVVTTHEGAPKLPVAELNNRKIAMKGPESARTFVWKNWEAQGGLILSQTKR